MLMPFQKNAFYKECLFKRLPFLKVDPDKWIENLGWVMLGFILKYWFRVGCEGPGLQPG